MTSSTLPVLEICIAGFICLAKVAPGFADEVIPYLEPKLVSKLENSDINESSGLACSQIAANRFWTHNDSGDKPRLFCFDKEGNHLGTCKLKKSKATDWEDMCSFRRSDKPRLLVGDIGDNGKRRKSVRLYLVEEPSRPDTTVKPLQEIKLEYSTGAMDCEGLAVDAQSGKILLVEKRRWITCRIFQADLPAEKKSEVKLKAKPIAEIRLPLVTAMDISADGQRAIVLTLGQAFEFRRGPKEDWSAAFARSPRIVNLPPRKQGEAICYGPKGRNLYLTSEFAPCPFFEVRAGVSKSSKN